MIYPNEECFEIGGSKTLHASGDDAATAVAAGITVFEARKAYRMLQADGISIRVIDAIPCSRWTRRPWCAQACRPAGRSSQWRTTTRPAAWATPSATPSRRTASRYAAWPWREAPRSGKPAELLDRYGISAACIAAAVRRQVAAQPAVTVG